jgi:hypothetical protein
MFTSRSAACFRCIFSTVFVFSTCKWMYILLRTDRELSENDILKVYFVAIISLMMRKNVYLSCKVLIPFITYPVLGSDYAEFARRDIGDVTITHISTPCKKCISISARVQKMHINISTCAKNAYQWCHNEKNVTKNKSMVKYCRIFTSSISTILAW